MQTVAIIGRTNVGKSTLFNRLLGQRKAIVSSRAGTTRDRNFASVSWNGKNFTLVDTGGLEDPDDKKYSSKQEKRRLQEIEKSIKKQALVALKQADSIIFVLNIRDGVMPQEKKIADILRKSKKPITLAINKATSKSARDQENAEYYKLGLGEPILVSATTGIGTGDLLDAVTKNLSTDAQKTETETIKPYNNETIISIIGRPNVGKSSLLNIFAKEERAIVSSQPHTTREAQEIVLKYKDQTIKLIDTAGVRRKSKIDNHLERTGVKQSLETLKDSDLILFIIDSNERLAKQDQALARLIKDSNKPTIILANKWDLVKGVEMNEYEINFKKYFPHLSYAPFIFISCKNKRNIDKILDTAIKLHEESSIEITPNALNKFLTRIMGNLKKFQGKSKTVPRLIDLRQTSTSPPAFEIIMKESKHKKPHPSTIKYVENQIREKFNLKNIPVRVTLRTVKIKP